LQQDRPHRKLCFKPKRLQIPGGLAAGDVKIPVPEEIRVSRPGIQRTFPDCVDRLQAFGCRNTSGLPAAASPGRIPGVAPDLYYRQGDVSKLENFDEIFKIIQVPDARVMSDLDAADEWAPETRATPNDLE
jgi:carboxymethylenebutenolidase